MFESKYSKVLTVILVIVIVLIVGLLGFLAYDYYQKYVIQGDASNFVDDFEGEFSDGEATNTSNNDNTEVGSLTEGLEDAENTGVSTQNKTYKGFGVLGTMEIPATNFSYPVLEKITKKSSLA